MYIHLHAPYVFVCLFVFPPRVQEEDRERTVPLRDMKPVLISQEEQDKVRTPCKLAELHLFVLQGGWFVSSEGKPNFKMSPVFHPGAVLQSQAYQEAS